MAWRRAWKSVDLARMVAVDEGDAEIRERQLLRGAKVSLVDEVIAVGEINGENNVVWAGLDGALGFNLVGFRNFWFVLLADLFGHTYGMYSLCATTTQTSFNTQRHKGR